MESTKKTHFYEKPQGPCFALFGGAFFLSFFAFLFVFLSFVLNQKSTVDYWIRMVENQCTYASHKQIKEFKNRKLLPKDEKKLLEYLSANDCAMNSNSTFLECNSKGCFNKNRHLMEKSMFNLTHEFWKAYKSKIWFKKDFKTFICVDNEGFELQESSMNGRCFKSDLLSRNMIVEPTALLYLQRNMKNMQEKICEIQNCETKWLNLLQTKCDSATLEEIHDFSKTKNLKIPHEYKDCVLIRAANQLHEYLECNKNGCIDSRTKFLNNNFFFIFQNEFKSLINYAPFYLGITLFECVQEDGSTCNNETKTRFYFKFKDGHLFLKAFNATNLFFHKNMQNVSLSNFDDNCRVLNTVPILSGDVTLSRSSVECTISQSANTWIKKLKQKCWECTNQEINEFKNRLLSNEEELKLQESDYYTDCVLGRLSRLESEEIERETSIVFQNDIYIDSNAEIYKKNHFKIMAKNYQLAKNSKPFLSLTQSFLCYNPETNPCVDKDAVKIYVNSSKPLMEDPKAAKWYLEEVVSPNTRLTVPVIQLLKKYPKFKKNVVFRSKEKTVTAETMSEDVLVCKNPVNFTKLDFIKKSKEGAECACYDQQSTELSLDQAREIFDAKWNNLCFFLQNQKLTSLESIEGQIYLVQSSTGTKSNPVLSNDAVIKYLFETRNIVHAQQSLQTIPQNFVELRKNVYLRSKDEVFNGNFTHLTFEEINDILSTGENHFKKLGFIITSNQLDLKNSSYTEFTDESLHLIVFPELKNLVENFDFSKEPLIENLSKFEIGKKFILNYAQFPDKNQTSIPNYILPMNASKSICNFILNRKPETSVWSCEKGNETWILKKDK